MPAFAGMTSVKMKILVPIVLILSFILAGCGKVSDATLDEVLEKDPSFRRMLDEKNRVNAKVASLNEAFEKEKKLTLKKVTSLKKKIDLLQAELKTEIDSVKNRMAPKIEGVRNELGDARATEKVKARLLKGSVQKVKNIKKLLAKKNDLSLSGDEISIWNKRASELEKEIDTLKKEIGELRDKSRLLKTEIRILTE